jgi:quercetin dioxygenase-like cupin family protein
MRYFECFAPPFAREERASRFLLSLPESMLKDSYAVLYSWGESMLAPARLARAEPKERYMSGTQSLSKHGWAVPASEIARRILPALLLAASVFSAQAQDAGPRIVKLPDQIEYKGLPGTLQIATLYGDPSKPEVFVQRFKIPAGLKLTPHYHPDSPRTVAVLSGTLYYAFGEVWDESKLKALPAGTFFTEPPKAAHFAWAKDGEVVLQLTSIGPTCATMIKAPE